MSLSICPWKYGKQWVYSITYDEALCELRRFAIPIHEEYGLPGHVEVVVGQIGEIRRIGNSSFNGFRHMNGEELRELLAMGWGVGNHSWSHEIITPERVDRELRQAKSTLEEAINAPVLLYCSPGDNTNMADHVLEACRRFGYLAAMSITDALNLPDRELFWLNRTPLHDHYYAPFFSAYDPYRNIRYARQMNGWIIDYCHCPLEEPVHPNKDCSEAQLRKRFETVLSEGEEEVWCAVPEEALSYHLTRTHTQIEIMEETRLEYRYRLRLDGLPVSVPYPALTLDCLVPAAWCLNPHITVDERRISASVVRPMTLRVTVDVHHGMELVFRKETK
jgi:hypothetical protein